MTSQFPIAVYDQNIIPNSYVQSCSECSMIVGPDGKPNIAGILQRQAHTIVIDNDHGHLELLNCTNCPVNLATYHKIAKTADGKTIYWKGTDKPLYESDLLNLLEDGAAEPFVDIR